MAAVNKRIFWAIEEAALAPMGTATFGTASTGASASLVHGLQTLGITTRFLIEQIFEIGQLTIYQNVENIPEIECTMEKVLDGYPLLHHLATNGAPNGSLAGRSNQRCMLGMSIFNDQQNSASGTPIASVVCSGMYWSSSNFTFAVEGSFTESMGLVGNNKQWFVSGASGQPYTFTGQFNTNADTPLSVFGVQRRQHLMWGPVAGTGTYTTLPQDIAGASSSGTNDADALGNFNVHVQSIRCGVNLGRRELFELGRRAQYHRFVEFPVEVKTDYEIIAISGDMVDAYELGRNLDGSNTVDRSIRIKAMEGTYINAGDKNRLMNVTYGGANAGARGGNATVTYSYVSFDDFTVGHPQDPSNLGGF